MSVSFFDLQREELRHAIGLDVASRPKTTGIEPFDGSNKDKVTSDKSIFGQRRTPGKSKIESFEEGTIETISYANTD